MWTDPMEGIKILVGAEKRVPLAWYPFNEWFTALACTLIMSWFSKQKGFFKGEKFQER